MSKKTYVALVELKHSNKDGDTPIAVGETLPEALVKKLGKDIDDLIARGFVGYAKDVIVVEAEAPQAASDEEVLTAISKLDDKNDDHWTRGGVPQVSALAQISGRTVTAEQRDRLWAELNKDK